MEKNILNMWGIREHGDDDLHSCATSRGVEQTMPRSPISSAVQVQNALKNKEYVRLVVNLSHRLTHYAGADKSNIHDKYSGIKIESRFLASVDFQSLS